MGYKTLHNLHRHHHPSPPRHLADLILYTLPLAHATRASLTRPPHLPICYQIFQYATTLGPTALAIPRPGTLFSQIFRTKNPLPKEKEKFPTYVKSLLHHHLVNEAFSCHNI